MGTLTVSKANIKDCFQVYTKTKERKRQCCLFIHHASLLLVPVRRPSAPARKPGLCSWSTMPQSVPRAQTTGRLLWPRDTGAMLSRPAHSPWSQVKAILSLYLHHSVATSSSLGSCDGIFLDFLHIFLPVLSESHLQIPGPQPTLLGPPGLRPWPSPHSSLSANLPGPASAGYELHWSPLDLQHPSLHLQTSPFSKLQTQVPKCLWNRAPGGSMNTSDSLCLKANSLFSPPNSFHV